MLTLRDGDPVASQGSPEGWLLSEAIHTLIHSLMYEAPQPGSVLGVGAQSGMGIKVLLPRTHSLVKNSDLTTVLHGIPQPTCHPVPHLSLVTRNPHSEAGKDTRVLRTMSPFSLNKRVCRNLKDRYPSTTVLLPESTMAETGGGTRNGCFEHCAEEGLLQAERSGRKALLPAPDCVLCQAQSLAVASYIIAK